MPNRKDWKNTAALLLSPECGAEIEILATLAALRAKWMGLNGGVPRVGLEDSANPGLISGAPSGHSYGLHWARTNVRGYGEFARRKFEFGTKSNNNPHTLKLIDRGADGLLHWQQHSADGGGIAETYGSIPETDMRPDTYNRESEFK